MLNVLDFGAVGDGVTDDTTAVQAALNAAGGTATLVFPRRPYLCAALTVPSGIRWMGEGAALICDPSVPTEWLTAGASGYIEGMEFDYAGNSHGYHILRLADNSRGWKIRDSKFFNMKTRAALRCTWSEAGGGDILIADCDFLHGDGAGATAFYALAAGLGIDNIRLRDLVLDDVGSSGISIAMIDSSGDTTTGRFGAFTATRISNVTYKGNGTGTYGAIPMELWGHDNFNVSGVIIDEATRGIGLNWVRNGVCNGNTISNQSLYAYELNNWENVVINGTAAQDCATFVNDTAGDGFVPSKGLVVTGNAVMGTGRSSTISNIWFVGFAASTGHRRSDVLIGGNSFVGPAHISGGIRLTDTDRWTVTGNRYVALSEHDGFIFCNADDGSEFSIHDNDVVLATDYTTNNPGYNNKPFVITVGAAADRKNAFIANNRIASLAASIAGVGFGGIGLYSGAQDFGQISVKKNTTAGNITTPINIPDNGGEVVIADNDDLW